MVAPLAGAWIEMTTTVKTIRESIGRSPCGSVD